MSQSITSIVITGGPCSGKSTGMSYLTQKLKELGFAVLVVPELATEIIMAGAKGGGNISIFDFQEALLLEQLARQKFYRTLAQKIRNDKIVILFDRGVLDIKAYIHRDGWEAMLQDNNLSEIGLRDKNYDAVIHLRSAAIGAEEFYTISNNSARLESLEEAATMCEKTLHAWVGHPHLHVIDNSTDFDGKLKRVLQAVLHTLGVPIPLEIEKKYLISQEFKLANIPCPYTVTEIEQAYLPLGFRIRKRGQTGVFVYTKTHKEETQDPTVRMEKENIISAREYEMLIEKRISAIPKLYKKRICFVFKEQYFELDIFEGKPLILLEIELTDRHMEVSLPAWLPIMREVTEEKEFRNFEIANTL